MNISSKYEVMIFRTDYEGKQFYKIGLSKKREDGGYENGYMPVQFKKEVVLENQTKINIKNAWLTFYKDKDKKTIPYIFINEFSLFEELAKPKPTPEVNESWGKAQDMRLETEDLPFY